MPIVGYRIVPGRSCEHRPVAAPRTRSVRASAIGAAEIVRVGVHDGRARRRCTRSPPPRARRGSPGRRGLWRAAGDAVQRGLDDHRGVGHGHRAYAPDRILASPGTGRRGASDARTGGAGRLPPSQSTQEMECPHPARSSATPCCVGRTRGSSRATRSTSTTSRSTALLPRGVRALDDRARRDHVDRHVARRRRCPGVLGVYTGDDLGLDPVQGFVMLPPVFTRPPFADGPGALRRRHRRRGRRRDPGAGGRRRRAGDRRLRPAARWWSTPRRRSPTVRRCCSPSTARTSRSSSTSVTDPTVLDGAEVVVERAVREPTASRRCRWSRTGSSSSPTATGGCTCLRPDAGPARRPASRSPRRPGSTPRQVRVIAPAVGGGFGAKTGHVRRVRGRGEGSRSTLGRPVKWTETRSENMVAMTQGRAQVQHVEMGLKRDGTIVGVRVKIVRRRRRVPDDRRVPPVPHPHDVAGRVHDPEGGVQRPGARRRTPRRPPRTAAPGARRRPRSSSGSSTWRRTSSASTRSRSASRTSSPRGLPAHHGDRCELRRR